MDAWYHALSNLLYTDKKLQVNCEFLEIICCTNPRGAPGSLCFLQYGERGPQSWSLLKAIDGHATVRWPTCLITALE